MRKRENKGERPVKRMPSLRVVQTESFPESLTEDTRFTRIENWPILSQWVSSRYYDSRPTILSEDIEDQLN